MEKQALVSHAKGKKHQKRASQLEKVKTETKSITEFCKGSTAFSEKQKDTSDGSSGTELLRIPNPEPQQETMSQPATVQGSSSGIKTFATVLKAEILWAVKTVMCHLSCNSSKGRDKLFPVMFPDSEVASRFKCGPQKCNYPIAFGLSPYFRGQIMKAIREAPYYVVSFDESMNRVTKNEQMDLVVRFWDDKLSQVASRYLGSEFLGHTRSEDLLSKFKQGISELKMNLLLQVSMDGPHVNWKYFLKSFLKIENMQIQIFLA